MFGGAGVYADGVMFALGVRDVLYFKTAPEQTARFAAEGCAPFEYARAGRTATLTSYWRVPDRLYDEPAELAEWGADGINGRRSKTAAQTTALIRRYCGSRSLAGSRVPPFQFV
jgi:DNA transformation protein and related proteins